MGRLFWKFFLVFLVAQVATTLSVTVTIWIRHDLLRDEPGPGPQRPLVACPPSEQGAQWLPGPPPGPLNGPRPGPPRGSLNGPPPGPPPRPMIPVVPLVAGLIASLLFSALLARGFSRRIRSLRSAVNEVARGNLSVHPGEGMGGGNDELADLGHDLDRMTDRLRALVENQRRLLHQVSHEMRSPLARQQVAIDLARQRPGTEQAALDRVEQELQRMDALVGELLTLSRLDAGGIESGFETVDLSELLQEIVDNAAFEARARNCTVQAVLPASAPLPGHAELLSRALENVVRNALKFTKANSRVLIELEQTDAADWKLSVCDEGYGVPEADLEQIFNPFYRGSGAVDGQTGYGLGLAIALSVIEAHGGRIQASNRATGGLCVEVLLPMHTPD